MADLPGDGNVTNPRNGGGDWNITKNPNPHNNTYFQKNKQQSLDQEIKNIRDTTKHKPKSQLTKEELMAYNQRKYRELKKVLLLFYS